ILLSLTVLTHFFFSSSLPHPFLHSFPTRRSSDLLFHTAVPVSFKTRLVSAKKNVVETIACIADLPDESSRIGARIQLNILNVYRSEEHTSELQSLAYLVCRLLLEKKKQK